MPLNGKALALALGATLALSACQQRATSAQQDKNPYLRMDTLLVRNACSNCHASDYARVGPAMTQVAAIRGPDTPESRKLLRDMILNGTKGAWGEAVMPKQQQVTPQAADELAQAILALPAHP